MWRERACGLTASARRRTHARRSAHPRCAHSRWRTHPWRSTHARRSAHPRCTHTRRAPAMPVSRGRARARHGETSSTHASVAAVLKLRTRTLSRYGLARRHHTPHAIGGSTAGQTRRSELGSAVQGGIGRPKARIPRHAPRRHHRVGDASAGSQSAARIDHATRRERTHRRVAGRARRHAMHDDPAARIGPAARTVPPVVARPIPAPRHVRVADARRTPVTRQPHPIVRGPPPVASDPNIVRGGWLRPLLHERLRRRLRRALRHLLVRHVGLERLAEFALRERQRSRCCVLPFGSRRSSRVRRLSSFGGASRCIGRSFAPCTRLAARWIGTSIGARPLRRLNDLATTGRRRRDDFTPRGRRRRDDLAWATRWAGIARCILDAELALVTVAQAPPTTRTAVLADLRVHRTSPAAKGAVAIVRDLIDLDAIAGQIVLRNTNYALMRGAGAAGERPHQNRDARDLQLSHGPHKTSMPRKSFRAETKAPIYAVSTDFQRPGAARWLSIRGSTSRKSSSTK